MQIVIAPIKLKEGISEEEFLKASEKFENDFVSKQQGIEKRILVKDQSGSYADIVFFTDMEAMEQVLEAEKNSSVCHDFFSLMEESDDFSMYEVVKTYESN